MNGHNNELRTHSKTKNLIFAFFSSFFLFFQYLFTFCLLTHNIQATLESQILSNLGISKTGYTKGKQILSGFNRNVLTWLFSKDQIC